MVLPTFWGEVVMDGTVEVMLGDFADARILGLAHGRLGFHGFRRQFRILSREWAIQTFSSL
jgi:hypothetical protein